MESIERYNHLNKYLKEKFGERVLKICIDGGFSCPNIVIHRISGDAPKDLLVAPEWNSHKKWIINGLDKMLKEQNLYQGIYFSKK